MVAEKGQAAEPSTWKEKADAANLKADAANQKANVAKQGQCGHDKSCFSQTSRSSHNENTLLQLLLIL